MDIENDIGEEFNLSEGLVQAPANQQRTDWSKDDRMKDAVEEWDNIMRLWKNGELDMDKWGRVFTRGKPSKRKFAAEFKNINPDTFQRYAHDDLTKRRKIGTKLGRNKIEKVKAIKNPRAAPGYEWLHQSHRSRNEAMLEVEEEILEGRKEECASLIPKGRRYEVAPRTRLQENDWKVFWSDNLPEICNMMGASDEFLQNELDYKRRCDETVGFAKCYYIGPNPYDIPNSKRTKQRLERMDSRLKNYKLVHTRHALSMLHSKVSETKLLVTLDTLIERYDRSLEAKGLQPSDLRWRLRACNHMNQKGCEQQKEKELDIDDANTIDGLSLVERNAYCKQMREEIVNEEQPETLEEDPSRYFSRRMPSRYNTYLSIIEAEQEEEDDKSKNIDGVDGVDIDSNEFAEELRRARASKELTLKSVNAHCNHLLRYTHLLLADANIFPDLKHQLKTLQKLCSACTDALSDAGVK